jgi:hypothetical protein
MFLTGHTALGLLALAASAPRLVSALDPDICATFNTGNMEKCELTAVSYITCFADSGHLLSSFRQFAE